MTNSGYNGWSNRATWNVSLWINNDEGMYNLARDYMAERVENKEGIDGSYSGFVKRYGLESEFNGDNIHWLDRSLDHKELDEMMKEMVD